MAAAYALLLLLPWDRVGDAVARALTAMARWRDDRRR
jgi:hypothetical protein